MIIRVVAAVAELIGVVSGGLIFVFILSAVLPS